MNPAMVILVIIGGILLWWSFADRFSQMGERVKNLFNHINTNNDTEEKRK